VVKFILASQSPRRQILLKKIIPDFEAVPSGADENVKEYESPEDFAVKAAILKGNDVKNSLSKNSERKIIFSADTIVVLGNTIYGKPKDESDAKRIIRELMKKEHKVITGYAVIDSENEDIISGYEVSLVKIKTLNESELDYYVKYSNCMDKAGAYAIQDMKSFEKRNVTGNTTNFDIVESYSGSYDNIVGLPTEKLKTDFKKIKI